MSETDKTIWLSEAEVRDALARAGKPPEQARREPLDPAKYLEALAKQRAEDRYRSARRVLDALRVKGGVAKSTALAASIGPEGIAGIWAVQKTTNLGQETYELRRVPGLALSTQPHVAPA